MAVSSTSVRGFSLYKDLRGAMLAGTTLDIIIDNSVTLTLGDAVRIDTAGYLKTASTSGCILGIVVGLTDQNDLNVFEASRVAATSIAGATLVGQDTLTTSSTNTSDGTRNLKAKVLVDPAGMFLFRNQANTTVALAQTNLLQFFNLTSAGQIDSNSASDTSGQFQLVALDPDADGSTAKGLFRLVQQQLAVNQPSYGSTAIIAA